jgi:hypothetical protein
MIYLPKGTIMHIDNEPWDIWFAWYPVRTSLGWRWLQMVWRRGDEIRAMS